MLLCIYLYKNYSEFPPLACIHASKQHRVVPDKIQLSGLVPAVWCNYQDAVDWVIAISSAARMLCLMNPHKTKSNDFR